MQETILKNGEKRRKLEKIENRQLSNKKMFLERNISSFGNL